MFTKILVGYDGSNKADRALRTAIELVKLHPSTGLEVLYIIRFSHTIIGDTYIPSHYRAKENAYIEGETILVRARNIIGSACLKANLQMMEGQPASMIIEFAEDHQCDLIVIGSSKSGFLKKWRYGNVCGKVVQHSSIPALVVK